MHRLLSTHRPPPAALALLLVSAACFAVAGFEHARLFHRGYAEVEVVGPLFWLNGLGTLVVLLLLVFDYVGLYVVGSLAISLGSIVSILISHNGEFFGFAEGGWDGDATLIIATEAASVVLVLAALALGALRGADAARTTRADGSVAA